MAPFILSVIEIRAMRESQIPYWADDLSPAEADAIMICDSLASELAAEYAKPEK